MQIHWKSCTGWALLPALCIFIDCSAVIHGQNLSEVTAHLEIPRGDGPKTALPSSAIWLTPQHASPLTQARNDRAYTLLQKNKQFSPHLLVVPVGSVVHFPNADPFFHNVFSLFDGRRFDLGLYEAGTTRDVTFGREGISYIFCNIHPEMSAVIIALATPFYATEEAQGRFRIQDVPADDYTLHVWVEGEDEAVLKALTRKVHIAGDHFELGAISLPSPPHPPTSHENKYGTGYDTREPSVY
jgi:plastocyanin